MKNEAKQTVVDAYCPECEAYICDEQVTFEECCDTCGTSVEYHDIEKQNEILQGGNNEQQ